MSTPVPGVRYAYERASRRWTSPGRLPLPFTLTRDDLVPGTYVPSRETTGAPAGTVFTEFMAPSLTNNRITLTMPGGGNDPEILANGVPVGSKIPGIRRHRFWGKVVPQSQGMKTVECVIAGPHPDTVSATSAQGCVQNYGSNPPHFTMIDTTLDTTLWHTERGAPLDALIHGVHGGNFTMIRGYVQASDAISYQGPNGSLAAANAAYCLIEASYLEAGVYQNDIYTPGGDDGQMHNDIFQTVYGKNITIRYNLLGGPRDVTPYITWPNGPVVTTDPWNSVIMLQQGNGLDVTNPIYWMENIHIDYNWMGGGSATINHPYSSTWGNRFADSSIKNNKILQRGDDWGFKMRANGPGQAGYRNDTPRVGGYYVLRGSNLATDLTGNTIATLTDGVWTDTGIPAPISNG